MGKTGDIGRIISGKETAGNISGRVKAGDNLGVYIKYLESGINF